MLSPEPQHRSHVPEYMTDDSSLTVLILDLGP